MIMSTCVDSRSSFGKFFVSLTLTGLLFVTPLISANAQTPQHPSTQSKPVQDAPAKPQASPSPVATDTAKKPEDEKKPEDTPRPRDPMSTPTFNGLRLRSIGPAFTSGRVSGFAVDPTNHSRYFVAVASGGVWKTVNSGTTWTPVFDSEGSYSIGAITLDPKNPITVGSALARTTVSAVFRMATESIARTTVVAVGETLVLRLLNTLVESPSIRRTRILFTSLRKDLCGDQAANAGYLRLLMAVRPGRTFLTSASTPELQMSPSIQMIQTRSTPQLINAADTCGRSLMVGRKVRSTNQPTQARAGTNCERACQQ